VLFTLIKQSSHLRGDGWASGQFVWLCGLFLLMLIPQAESQEVYRWVDDHGRVHIVDQINRVPDAYRDTLKVYPVSSDVKRAQSTGKSEPLHAVSGVSQENGSAGTSTSRSTEMDEVTLAALRERMTQVREEKTRLRVLKIRFKANKTRAAVYQKRIKELDEEGTDIQGEIEEILGSDE